MKHFLILLLFTSLLVTPAQADWRWAQPKFKPHTAAYFCDSPQCIKVGQLRAHVWHRARVARYNHYKEFEWHHWTSLSIPTCTWYGESGRGPEYAPYRYTMPNSQGSGALGKYQFMSGTYHDNAKYHDWSPLDQEIAVRREYWKHGTSPWSNCH